MKNQIWLSVVTASLLLIGCGGASSTTASNTIPSSTAPSEKIGIGFYVDAEIEGVEYKCGSQEGTTDENGTFTFESGKNCTFTLGDLKLREVNASSLDNNVSVLEDNEIVAQLLQTLDIDGNASNGIRLSEHTGRVIRDELTSLDKPLDRDLLEAIHDAIKAEVPNEYQGRVVDVNETQRHINETRQRLEREGRRTQYDIEAEHGRTGDNNGTVPTQEERETREEEFSDEHNRTTPTQEEREVRQEEFSGEQNRTIPTEVERESRQEEFSGENNINVEDSQQGANENTNGSDSSNAGDSSQSSNHNQNEGNEGNGRR